MSTPTQTFLVTGATGSQGGATARYLLSQNHRVYVLVRNPSSPSALNPPIPRHRGIPLTSVFINTSPQLVPSIVPKTEMQHARNIIAAALAAKSATSLVYTSAIRTGQHDSVPGFDANSFRGACWLAKHGIEELVRRSGLQWTILRPAMLMKNFLPPISNFSFPELGTEGVLLTAYKPDIQFTLLSEGDVGAFAAEAMLNPEAWHGKEITLGAETMGILTRQLFHTKMCNR